MLFHPRRELAVAHMMQLQFLLHIGVGGIVRVGIEDDGDRRVGGGRRGGDDLG